MEQEDQGCERRREARAGLGLLVPGAPASSDVHPDLASGSCHTSSLRHPGLCGPGGAPAPFSSPLRTCFVYLHQGRPGDPSRYVFGAGRAGTCVTAAQTHNCVSLACTRVCTHLTAPTPTRLLVKTPGSAHKNGHMPPRHHCRSGGATPPFVVEPGHLHLLEAPGAPGRAGAARCLWCLCAEHRSSRRRPGQRLCGWLAGPVPGARGSKTRQPPVDCGT